MKAEWHGDSICLTPEEGEDIDVLNMHAAQAMANALLRLYEPDISVVLTENFDNKGVPTGYELLRFENTENVPADADAANSTNVTSISEEPSHSLANVS